MWDVPSEPNLGVPRCKWGVPQAIVYEGNAPVVDGNALAVMGRTLYAWKLPVLTGMFQTGCHPSHQTTSSNVMVHKKICTVTVIMYSHTCLVNMQVYGTIFDEVQYTLYNKPIIQPLLQATTQGLAWIKYDPVSLYAKAKACKGFLISLLAAQYVQKCMQYYHLFGICDVTPRDVPHQMWEAQIRNMGSPDIHTWASRTLPTMEPQPNLSPIGPIMYWDQLDPMGLGKGLTEVLKTGQQASRLQKVLISTPRLSRGNTINS
ncbi:hypothetical protein B0H19DRAFT_1079645 [Mycena capillaripes]|nr:hypothetical protein B0H19DRAFT_1079645 [Mycena capillaripes]